jgi:lipid A 3-O-deacylase
MLMVEHRHTVTALLLAIGMALGANSAAAQDQPAKQSEPAAQDQPTPQDRAAARVPEDELGTLSLVVENDLFVDRDRHYTNGVRLSWLTPLGKEPGVVKDAARMVPMFAGAQDIRVEFALGQSMFTPTDTSQRIPDPNDRPYAGWLYANVGVVAETGRRLDQMALGIGIIGPASLAEQTQKFVHDLRNFDKPRGWDSQLENEPTIQLTWQSSWRALVSGPLFWGFGFDATPHAGVAIGNVFDYVNGGVTLRLGQNLPDDFGPPRVEPSLPGSGFFKSADSRFGWYLFAGVDGRAVARNMFLDGNTFRDSPDVDSKPFVGDLQLGFAVVIDDVRLAYTHVFRTREFDGQNRPDKFGAISVSTRF